MRKIYIATHGDFSKGLKHSLQMIVGNMAEDIQTYSLYPGESSTDFAKKLDSEIKKNIENEYVILGDLFGASVVNSLIEIAEYDNVVLFSGVNLNLALEVVLSQAARLTDPIIEEMLQSARLGIMRIKAVELEDEEF
ncbi:MAG: PTS sugar transporter subunit IIA [Lactobacillales bacterium]|nr:PTS sugar transporter subunit IIA [Lactobacillales bacterium]